MRIISITGQKPEPADCNEESGVVSKVHLPLVRREFLKGTGLLFGALTAGTLLASLAPSKAWALELKKLSTAEGQTLMAMGRVLYPHKNLPDAVYALLAKDLDATAGTDASTATLLQEGIAELNKLAGRAFVKASAAKKESIVRGLEGTPFFSAVRAQCVTSIYDNDMAYALFGYPGSAWEKGGYITRGFQDLKWLPAPSKEASPAPYMG